MAGEASLAGEASQPSEASQAGVAAQVVADRTERREMDRNSKHD